MAKPKIKEHPLVLVFYLDRDFMNSKHIGIFAESVNEIIQIKQLNAVAFFMPTDGEERIECLNPIVVSPVDMYKVDKMINDINKHFGVGENPILDDQTE